VAHYTLQVEPPPGLKPPDPDATARPRGWTPTFCPGVSVANRPAPFALEPGSDLAGLEIEHLAVPTHSVRGVMLNRVAPRAERLSCALGNRPAPACSVPHGIEV